MSCAPGSATRRRPIAPRLGQSCPVRRWRTPPALRRGPPPSAVAVRCGPSGPRSPGAAHGCWQRGHPSPGPPAPPDCAWAFHPLPSFRNSSLPLSLCSPCILKLVCDNQFTKGDQGAADRNLLGHGRPDISEGRRTPHGLEPEQYPWLNVKLFVGLWTRFPYPACATQGVPRRANALSCNSSLRITATKAKLPGFPR